MKTLQDCKNEVAKQYGFDAWDSIDFYMLDAHDQIAVKPYAEERLWTEAAELYTQQFKPSPSERLIIPLIYNAGMSEYFRMHDYRNMWGLWEKFCAEFQQIRKSGINWYSKEEIDHYLKTKGYSVEIRNELSSLWYDSLQGAFDKGYEKSQLQLSSSSPPPVSEQPSEELRDGTEDEIRCGECYKPLTLVRPGKHQCDYCELREEIESFKRANTILGEAYHRQDATIKELTEALEKIRDFEDGNEYYDDPGQIATEALSRVSSSKNT